MTTPHNGGCWYCHQDEPSGIDGELVFTSEFDAYVHKNCVREVLRKDPKDREARIIARDIGVNAPVIAEGLLKIESTDDGGQAIITQVVSTTDDNLFFRFQSWDEKCNHRGMKELLGKQVRITLEVIGEEVR